MNQKEIDREIIKTLSDILSYIGSEADPNDATLRTYLEWLLKKVKP